MAEIDPQNPDMLPRTKQSQRVRLTGLSPTQREQVARWIEAKVARLPYTIAQGKDWLRTHPDDLTMHAQLAHWTAALGMGRHLAWMVRREKPSLI